MKRLLPLVILMVMGAMLMISWSNISNAKTEETEKYNTLMQQAEAFESKKIYIDAVSKYEAALKLKPEYSLAQHVAELYKSLNNSGGYIKALETAISCDPTNPEPYFQIIEQYKGSESAAKLYHFVKRTESALAESDRITPEQTQEIEELLKFLLSRITVHPVSFDEFYGFHPYDGSGVAYCKVREGDKYGILKDDLSTFTQCIFPEIGYPNANVMPILWNDERYYMDNAGYRKIVTDSPATAIGAFGAGYAPVQIDGKYGYIDTKMKSYHFEYDYAGSFERGIAAVQQNGKWFAINTQFAQVGPSFDEILIDAYGFCSTYGVYFGRSGSSWGMYNTSGAKIADGFEEVRQFASTQPAAVKQDGKWGFLSLSGEMVLAPQFEEADSFSIGYAPVKQGELWGYINQEGKMLVDPQFKSLTPFNAKGCAIGENESGLCSVRITQYS